MCDIEILLSMPHPDCPSSEAVAHIDGFAHVLVIEMYATRIDETAIDAKSLVRTCSCLGEYCGRKPIIVPIGSLDRLFHVCHFLNRLNWTKDFLPDAQWLMSENAAQRDLSMPIFVDYSSPLLECKTCISSCHLGHLRRQWAGRRSPCHHVWHPLSTVWHLPTKGKVLWNGARGRLESYTLSTFDSCRCLESVQILSNI